MFASAGLISILYSQYAYFSFSPFNPIRMTDVNNGFISANDSLFSVKPHIFENDEKYDFDWDVLKNDENPFGIFQF
jgi:hypothetical protein